MSDKIMTHDDYKKAIDQDRAYISGQLKMWEENFKLAEEQVKYWTNQEQAMGTVSCRIQLGNRSVFNKD